MAVFQSKGRVKLFIVMSINRTKYGIMASRTPFGISRDINCVHIDLFLRIAATLFLMSLIVKVKGSTDLAHCIRGMLPSPLNTEE